RTMIHPPVVRIVRGINDPLEWKKAPPGFEPGMADLQSAALAAWRRGRSTCLIVVTSPREVNRKNRAGKMDRTKGRTSLKLWKVSNWLLVSAVYRDYPQSHQNVSYLSGEKRER